MPPRDASLRRFWFRTNPGYGIGVTAYTEEEAERLARKVAAQFEQEILDVTPDVDVQTLDQRHVILNMHPPNLHGVWFPMLGPLS